MKIFNTIIHLEEIPTCMKEGVIVPVYKGKGKDPLMPESYRGITMSSVIANSARNEKMSPSHHTHESKVVVQNC